MLSAKKPGLVQTSECYWSNYMWRIGLRCLFLKGGAFTSSTCENACWWSALAMLDMMLARVALPSEVMAHLARVALPTGNIRFFCQLFRSMENNWNGLKKGKDVCFPANTVTNIWGRTDFDVENLFFYLLGSKKLASQAWAGLGPRLDLGYAAWAGHRPWLGLPRMNCRFTHKQVYVFCLIACLS